METKNIPNNTTNKQRIAFVDLLKVLAIFIVITLHNGTWHTDFMASGNFANYLQYAIRLVSEGVPLFMLINGFLMFPRALNIKKHAKRTINIVAIVLIWSVVLEVTISIMQGVPLTVNGIITEVLNTYIASKRTGILWFLQSLVVVYIIFPVIKYVYDNNYSLFKYLLFVLIISTYTVNFISFISNTTGIEIFNSILFAVKQYSVSIGNNIYLIYFMVGGYLYKEKDKINVKLAIALAAISYALALIIGVLISHKNGVTYSSNYIYSQFFLLFIIVGLFLICSKLSLNNAHINKILAVIGDNTMGIYLLHRIIVVFFSNVLHLSGGLVFRLILSAVTLICGCIIAVVIRKIPKISYIIKL